MGFLLTAIAFIVIFSVLVLIHEWGHFYAARRAGIKVEEFGFGLPPRIWGKKKGETLYSINAIPFGGFVRLLGEDARDPKVAKDKRSFASKPARVRIAVIVAGVFMNFVLAWVLLTIGFIFGIQPMIVNSEEVLAGINNGAIKTEQGIIIKEVKNLSPAAQIGLQPGDRIVAVNGREAISSAYDSELKKDLAAAEKPLQLTIERGEQVVQHQLTNDKLGSGVVLYDVMYLPRLVVESVKPGSSTQRADVRSGDILLKINDTPVYFLEDYTTALQGQAQLQLTLLRNGDEIVNTMVSLPETELVIVNSVLPQSPAEAAGFKRDDLLVSINGEKVSTPQRVLALIKSSVGKTLDYVVRRDGREMTLTVSPSQDGIIGVGLSPLITFENQEMSVYVSDSPASVLKIEDVRYPFWIAPFKAFEESIKLSVLTVEMFGNVIRSLVTSLAVPEGVAGPVGIYQLTQVFLQEGLLSLMRFMALLSLSLAIINILPFPALDGGRLFFILVEVVTGKKVAGKFEAWVHAIGFVLLMLLIFAVTYNDILRLL